MNRILTALALAALSTASYAGTVTAADAVQFKVGSATALDVEAKLGAPQSVATNSDGTVVLTYASMKTKVKAATFIPIVGMFAGGATAKSSAVVFSFGADGFLKRTTTNETAMDCGIGSCK